MKLQKVLCFIMILFLTDTIYSIAKQCPWDNVENDDPPEPVSPVPQPLEPSPSGPSQPEVQSFTPADVSNMVNLSSGDLTYNIPLMDVGGYPINIAYNQGAGMEEDASCTGLGWNLSVGSINRIVRGLPDDFCGDEMTYEQYQKPNITFGITANTGIEFVGIGLTLGGAFSHNNYSGVNTDLSTGVAYGSTNKNGFNGSLGCTVGLNSDNGPYYSPNINISYTTKTASATGGLNFGFKASSYDGFESLSFGLKVSDKLVIADRNKKQIFRLKESVTGSHSFNSITSLAPGRYCPMVNYGFSGKIHTGGETQWFSFQGGIGMSYAEQRIKENEKQTPAYGYMFAQRAGDGDVILDFQRDEDAGVDNKVPDLPATAFTYDLFQANGQGLSGQFRAYRNDVGILHDPYIASSPQSNVNLGVEAEIGCVLGLGVDAGLVTALNQSGKWVEGNGITNRVRFTDTASADPGYRPFYFKEVGESTPYENDLYNRTLNSQVTRLEVTLGTLEQKFIHGLNETEAISRDLVNRQPLRCNNLFSYLDADEASLVGVDKKIQNFPLSSVSTPLPLPFDDDRSHSPRQNHHISEVTITKDDGIRYVYGIPAYNELKLEVSFNISGGGTAISENLVRYFEENFENYRNNSNGLNRAFSSTITPGYAYAYLLTDILSTDYTDRTGNGPTPDDNGTYTKFNYHKSSGNYRWRMPYLTQSAHLTTNTNNLESRDDGDDIASFSYGEKEVWYNQSIETKNYVALFYYSRRLDAMGVLGRNGGIDSANPEQQLLKLDSIALFARIAIGIPIQTVHFVYDYSLCKGTPNNINYYRRGRTIGNVIPEANTTMGKLTLKEIFFSYQKSSKGRLVKYKFSYQQNKNYNYSDAKNDRWGNYKENRAEFPNMSNKDFPYVQQKRKNVADDECAAWCLSRIVTPSNAAIDIEYESDDYAYVQDRPAMQMVGVLGFGEYDRVSGAVHTITSSDVLNIPTVRGAPGSSRFNVPHDVVFFKIEKREGGSMNCRELLTRMTSGVDKLFFNMNMQIANDNASSNVWTERSHDYEDVSGFMVSSEHGLAIFGPDTIGWIRTPYPEPIPESLFGPRAPDVVGYHPVTLAAFRYALENLPRIAKGEPGPLSEDVAEGFNEFSGRLEDCFLRLASISQNDWMFQHHIGNLIEPSRSYIRLNNPYLCKYGGGARVKRVRVNDNWSDMSGGQSHTYGVEYDYTSLQNGETISSGVATYEPEIGNDENPVYLPLTMGNYYNPKYRRVVTPVGRGFFPAANVVYAKVRVRSLQHDNIQRTGTGKTEYEFYTARDFPVWVSSTSPKMVTNMDSRGEQAANILASMFYKEDQLTVSQGHLIQLNDMPGKPKSVSVYQQGSSIPISGTSYIYKTNPLNPKLLDNDVDFIDTDGSVRSGLAAMESDFVVDTRYSWDRTWSPTLNFNINVGLIGPYPIPIPTGMPMNRYDGTLVHVVSATKVIHRTGILDSIIAFENGAVVTTKNIAYDGQTGQALLTETANEFRDRYYTLKVPAHWTTRSMGAACGNTGNEYRIDNYNASNGFASIRPPAARVSTLFNTGDEVIIKLDAFRDRLWVDLIENNQIRLIDRNGGFAGAGMLRNIPIKVIRSGKRNMQSIPAGEITLQTNPITGTAPAPRHLNDGVWTKVVSASATKFSDQWQTYNLQRVQLPPQPCICNNDERGRDILLRILAFVVRQDSFDFPSRRIPVDIISIAERRRVFHSDSLAVRSATRGTCAQITINNDCIITLCDYNGASVSGKFGEGNNSHITIVRPQPTGACANSSDFSVVINFKVGSGRTLTGTSSCIILDTCHSNPFVYDNTACDLGVGVRVNPYVEGIRGNYRPVANYLYNQGNRSPTGDRPLVLKESGFYDPTFRPYWECRAFRNADSELWTCTSTATKIDPNGRTLETKDAIGVFSADLYGFNKNLIVASAQNASYNQIAFESFEDDNYPVGNAPGSCASLKHWPLFGGDGSPGFIDGTTSHTGRNSLGLSPNATQTLRIKLSPVRDNSSRGASYSLRLADLTGYFKPIPGTYFVSAWVKLRNAAESVITTYQSAGVRVNGEVLSNRTNIIDGWQQVWGTITIGRESELSFELFAGSDFSYFDDVRIQPANASMKAFVYDPTNLRLCAELDENNFAT